MSYRFRSVAGSRGLRVVLAALLAGGCATATTHPQDPLENYNRGMFAFNDRVDRAVIKPVAEAYETVVPSPVRSGVGNVFGNLGDPWIAINNLLQGKLLDALSDGARFVMNTTVGVLGILDVATAAGLTKHDEDFGQTLGAWGVGEGAYLVLPFFGPRTVRDAAALPLDVMADDVWAIQHVPTRNSMTALRLVHTRSTLLGTEKTLEEGTIDKYAYSRDFYLEQRRYKVFDGNPPRKYEDFDDEGAALPQPTQADFVARAAVESLEVLAVGGEFAQALPPNNEESNP